MVFDATLNNITVISRGSALLMEEIKVPGEKNLQIHYNISDKNSNISFEDLDIHHNLRYWMPILAIMLCLEFQITSVLKILTYITT